MIKNKLAELGLLDLFPEMDDEDFQLKHPILQQIERFKVLDSLKHFESVKQSVEKSQVYTTNDVKPIGKDRCIKLANIDFDEKHRILSIGKDAISKGKVAAVILSGGQGTRLGYNGPKGMYNLGLQSNKTIFQLHIEKIMKIRELSKNEGTGQLPKVPIYIMTSDLNDTIIRDYFNSVNFFGYPRDDIYFFEQGLMPCVSNDGKIIVETETSLSLAPDGNGGIYYALQLSGAISHMDGLGVEHLHVYGIDNVLTKSLDPLFLGICIGRGLDCGNKVVKRASKNEKVGVTTTIENRMHVLEYSELPAALADALDDGGNLLFGAANICNHYLSFKFLVNIVLPNLTAQYHLAPKKIPYLDPISRKTTTPIRYFLLLLFHNKFYYLIIYSNNGYKLEMFIFDVFPLAINWLVVEVERFDEFAPVKNEPGNSTDSPDTAIMLMSNQAKRWLLKAGAKLIDTNTENKKNEIYEISSLLSYEGEGLDHYNGIDISSPVYLKH